MIETPEPADSRPETRAPRKSRRLPARAAALPGREHLARLFDEAHMLALLQRELAGWSPEALRVTRCKLRPAKTAPSRRALERGDLELVYHVGLERADGREEELVLLAVAPVEPDFLRPLEDRARALAGTGALTFPFRRLTAYLPALHAALFAHVLDPALPALAEMCNGSAAELLAPHLEECRAGARLASVAAELRHYKPFRRAVLRLTAAFAPPARGTRVLYAKLFADGRGAGSHEDLVGLWSAAARSQHLRVPQPLGYDAGRRMLLMSEVPGRDLCGWIHSLEQGAVLGAEALARAERCMEVAAGALGELQRSGLQPRERRSFRAELEQLEAERELPSGVPAPEGLERRIGGLLERLAALAPAEEPLVPSHGGFRHKQTVGDERSLAIIDWDGFCLADPALDAATFLSRLQQGAASPGARRGDLERLMARFRCTFLECVPAARPALARYEALVLIEQVLRSFRRSRADGDSQIQDLARLAEERVASAAAGP